MKPGELLSYDPAAESATLSHVPLLDDSPTSAENAASVLLENKKAGRPLAIRVRTAISSEALALFDRFALDYVFCDFVDAQRVAMTKALADSLLRSRKSRRAIVGNFNIYPNVSIDSTLPATLPPAGAPRFGLKAEDTDYSDQRGTRGKTLGKQVAMPNGMLGSPDFRNPVTGNSNAPNIRAALFVLPIQRVTLAQLGLLGYSTVPEGSAAHAIRNTRPAAKQLVPIISRFNNFGNVGLDSDGNPTNGYAFVQNAANPANGQMISRGDFSALVMHCRMRGADTVLLFNAVSVVGYSPANASEDVEAGWNGSAEANKVFKRRTFGFANLKNTVGDQGGESDEEIPRSTEAAGVVWSGVYDRSGRARKLVLLVSNMSSITKTVDFPSIGGRPLKLELAAEDADNAVIEPGEHRLLSFRMAGKTWVLTGSSFPFSDNNRNGIGLGVADPP